ncbi:MAG TPA: hypothetical protein VKR53_05730, partial [Puia sp.]|nr:hypothetical protein [Puia sp.]
PKFNNPGKKPLLNTMLRKASEFKFPVKTKDDVKIIDKFLAEHNLNPRFIWLQPISQNSESTHICIDEARKRGWRVSVQTHKFLGLR